MSFSEYINLQRIAYAEQLMSTHPELSKTEVSLQSGYASPASFYRNYKLYKTKPEA
jgi:YesN/AraC family two-component response regulator